VLVDGVGGLWGLGWGGWILTPQPAQYSPGLTYPVLPVCRCLAGPVLPGSKPDPVLGRLDTEPRPCGRVCASRVCACLACAYAQLRAGLRASVCVGMYGGGGPQTSRTNFPAL